MLLQMGSIKNYMAVIDSIGCAGRAHGKSMISLGLSRFNLVSLFRPKWILDASVSSLMMILTRYEVFCLIL